MRHLDIGNDDLDVLPQLLLDRFLAIRGEMDLVSHQFVDTSDDGHIRGFIVHDEYTRHNTINPWPIFIRGTLGRSSLTKRYRGDSTSATPVTQRWLKPRRRTEESRHRLHFVKANGSTRSKVFKGREFALEPGGRFDLV